MSAPPTPSSIEADLDHQWTATVKPDGDHIHYTVIYKLGSSGEEKTVTVRYSQVESFNSASQAPDANFPAKVWFFPRTDAVVEERAAYFNTFLNKQIATTASLQALREAGLFPAEKEEKGEKKGQEKGVEKEEEAEQAVVEKKEEKKEETPAAAAVDDDTPKSWATAPAAKQGSKGQKKRSSKHKKKKGGKKK